MKSFGTYDLHASAPQANSLEHVFSLCTSHL